TRSSGVERLLPGRRSTDVTNCAAHGVHSVDEGRRGVDRVRTARRHIRVRYAGGAALRRLSAARVVAARASGPCRGRGAGVAHPRLPCPSARAYAAGVPGVAARDRRQSMPVPRREVTKTAAPLPAVVGVAGAGGVPGGVPGGRRLGQRRRPEAPGGARGALAATARGVSPEAPLTTQLRGDAHYIVNVTE